MKSNTGKPSNTAQPKGKVLAAAKKESTSIRQAPPVYRPQPLPKVLQKKAKQDPGGQSAKKISAVPNAPVIQRAESFFPTLMWGAIMYGIANWGRNRGHGGGGGGQQPLPNQQPLPTVVTNQNVNAPQHQMPHVTPPQQQHVPLVGNNNNGPLVVNNSPPPSPVINNSPTTTTTTTIVQPPTLHIGSSSSSPSGMPPRRTALDIIIEQNQQRNNNVLGLMKDSRARRQSANNNNNSDSDSEEDDGGGDSYSSFRAPKTYTSRSKKKYDKGLKGGVTCYLNGSKNSIEQGKNSTPHQHAERRAVAQAISKSSSANITLEQNAWPCEYCHPWLRGFAMEHGITITVLVTDDHGGYANWHVLQGKPPGNRGTITYHPDGRVTYQ